MAPEYLSELCFCSKKRPSTYRHRSSQSNQLTVPPVKLFTGGARSFAVVGPTPTTWNNLPEYLRTQVEYFWPPWLFYPTVFKMHSIYYFIYQLEIHYINLHFDIRSVMS